MKRLLCLLLALSSVLLLSACGGIKAADEEPGAVPDGEIEESTEPSEAIEDMKENILPTTELPAETETPTLILIEDTTIRNNIFTADALEMFWEDNNGKYYFPSIRSQYVIATFSDGSTMGVVEALSEELITIADLETYGIRFYKEEKATS